MDKIERDELVERILTDSSLTKDEQLELLQEVALLYDADDTRTPEQIALEADAQNWLRTIFPQYFKGEFAKHQKEHWAWVHGVERGVRSPPRVEIWPRGQGKSTSAEGACAMWGARGTRRYGWYISENQDQADDHVGNVAAMLESEKIKEFYPQLGERLVNKFGTSKGWKRNRIRTATGFTVDALGLDVAKRGVKLEEQRPDFIIIDDVDGKHDSPQVTAKKIEIITTSLLPAGSPDLIVLAVQNLIHKDSFFAQLADGRADCLQDRGDCSPIPAIRGFDYEKKPDGRVEITAGEPTWPEGMGLEVCQEKIDTWGIHAFLTECQHKVNLLVPGAIFSEWSELHHVITETEFKEFYGSIALDDPRLGLESKMRIPAQWTLGRGLDWGTTPGHPTACIWAARPYETHSLTDCVFIYRELTRPEFPYGEGEPEPVSPRRVKLAVTNAGKRYSEEKRMELSVMSHEASAAYNTFMHDTLEGEESAWFNKWKAQTGSGVPQIQNVLEIDWTRAHPFRKYPKDHPNKELAGQPLMGRPRFYVIVPDKQGELFVDQEEELKVRGWVDAAGMARLRYEIPRYRNPLTKAGQERPNPKANGEDDMVDGLRGLASVFFPQVQKMSREEKTDALLHPNLKAATIQERRNRGENVQGAEARRTHAVQKIQKKLNTSKSYSPLAAYRNRLKQGK